MFKKLIIEVSIIMCCEDGAPILISDFIFLGFAYVKEKCMLYHVRGRNNSANSFIRRQNARHDGVHRVVEGCGGEESSLH